MVTKTVTYEDFNGVERTDTLRFNLTKTEMAEISMELPEAFRKLLMDDSPESNNETTAEKILEELGNKGVFDVIKALIIKSYGVKHEDGSRFEKSKELSDAFAQSMAFDAIMVEFLTSQTAASDFVNELIPSKKSGVAAPVQSIG